MATTYPYPTLFIRGNIIFIENDRVIFTDCETDSAVIFFPIENFTFLQANPVTLFPSDSIINIGVEVGWLGFPCVAPNDLCFFSGKISAGKQYHSERYGDRNLYLIVKELENGEMQPPPDIQNVK